MADYTTQPIGTPRVSPIRRPVIGQPVGTPIKKPRPGGPSTQPIGTPIKKPLPGRFPVKKPLPGQPSGNLEKMPWMSPGFKKPVVGQPVGTPVKKPIPGRGEISLPVENRGQQRKKFVHARNAKRKAARGGDYTTQPIGKPTVKPKSDYTKAAQRKVEGAKKRYKGKYVSPDKYKGVVPKHLRGKYKGKYFGKEGRKGRA